ncbi:MAG: multiubiquitin domain-containing protein [Pyrinomonadaceae bacterium]
MSDKKSDAPGQNKEYKIIVNAREKLFKGSEISFNQVVELAFGTVSTNPNIVYSVTYKRGQGNKEGSMDKGDTVKVKEGMIFDVTQTDKS